MIYFACVGKKILFAFENDQNGLKTPKDVSICDLKLKFWSKPWK